MNLSLLILFPLLTAIAVIFCSNAGQIRAVSLLGSLVQLAAGAVLAFAYTHERAGGNTSQMLFQSRYSWYANLHIDYFIGVDGISIAMILPTAFVVFAGILISWNVEKMTKEYFLLLHLLSLGAYGFFISLDLFTMFFFLEIAVIPKFLLIGIWGSGKKEYSALKLALMLMGGSALVLVGLLCLYFNTDVSGGAYSFDMLHIAQMHIPTEVQHFAFPFLFIGFGNLSDA